MKKKQSTSRTIQIFLVALAGALDGCAGGWAQVTPDLALENEGRVVEAVELNDGQVIFFDPYDSAGSGPDTRARLYGETIEGTVNSAPRTINVNDVKRIQFAVEGKQLYPHLVQGAMFAAALVGVYFIVTWENPF